MPTGRTGYKRRPGNSWRRPYRIQTPEYQSVPAAGSTIAVGEINVGESLEQIISIQNIGNGSLVIKEPILTGDINSISVLTGLPLIAKGSTAQELKIRFNPQTPGDFTATLKLTTNDPNKSSVQYTFNYVGLAAKYSSFDPEPEQLIDFGEVDGLWGSDWSIIVTNSGNLPLTISPSIIGTDKDFFRLSEDQNPPFPLTLEPNGGF